MACGWIILGETSRSQQGEKHHHRCLHHNVRHENSNGVVSYLFSQENTPGQANAQPLIGPIVISEIMRSGADEDEFAKYIELYNNSDTAAPLGSYTLYGSHRGFKVEFQPPVPASLAARQRILVAKDGAKLRAAYPDIPAQTLIVEIPDSNLPDYGELSLWQLDPDSQRSLLMDEVYTFYATYDPGRCWSETPYPWPYAGSDSGDSLTRIDPGAYGDDPKNWQVAEPTPGR